MTRAVAIRIVGHPAMGCALGSALTTKELELMKAENKRLDALNGVRAYGDEKRWQDVSGALARKYSSKPAGRLYGAVLGLWALLWTVIFGWYAKLSAWNREP